MTNCARCALSPWLKGWAGKTNRGIWCILNAEDKGPDQQGAPNEDIEMTAGHSHSCRISGLRLAVLGTASVALLAGCQKTFDYDLRGNFGNALSTSAAARNASTGARPAPDSRGVISYPGYQVAVARQGDTVADVATRVGTDADALARFNGLKLQDPLRGGEVIALPTRVSEPSPQTGAATTGPIRPADRVDITELAGGAIDRVPASDSAPRKATEAPQTGVQPIRHKVRRGETAFTIARSYKVSVRSLAEWNGLGSDFAIREGQYLLIPVGNRQSPAAETTTAAPGAGSLAPAPPSSVQPLPADTNVAEAQPAKVDTPDLGKTQTATADTALAQPVRGKIIRAYAKGKNEGIDIQANAGSTVSAAESGTVAAITSDADDVPIIVIKHADNLLTVYANVTDITIKKGAAVKRGQKIASIRGGSSNYLHFEVRKGFESVDPTPYLN